MLRNIFVALVVAVGVAGCFAGPFPALLFYLWLAYFRPEAWIWNDWITATNLSFLVGAATVVLTVLVPGKGRLRFDWMLLTAAIFALFSFASAQWSLAPDWSWEWWTLFARVLVIGSLLTFHVVDERRYRLVLLVVALSLGLEAAKQGWAQLLLNPGARNTNTHPVLGDNNGVALGMFMLAPMLAALAATAKSSTERWIHRFLLMGVVMRGLSTYSRGGALAAGAVALVYALRSKRRFSVLLGVGAIVGVLLTTMPNGFWDRMGTIAAADDQRDSSVEGRLHFWRVAWRMGMDQPLLGVGFNAYSRVYDRYDTSAGGFGSQRAVHSTWFGVFAEMGVPGLVLLVVLVLGVAAACRSVRRRRPGAEPVLAYVTACEASLAAFVTGGTFLHAQYFEMFWHLICLAICVKRLPSGNTEET